MFYVSKALCVIFMSVRIVFFRHGKSIRQIPEGRIILVHMRQVITRKVHQTGEGQCEAVMRCAAGTSEPFAVKVGLHQGSAFSPFLFAITMDSLTESMRKETSDSW